MKYIRTKNGRISYLSREPNEELCDYEIITSKGTRTYCDESEVIKTADTIEELCDAFVFICEESNKPQLVMPMNFDYCKKVFNHTEIYGAIWTDQGLIYVAKMNEKGELELL